MKNTRKILASISAVCLAFSVGCGEKKSGSDNSVIYYDNSNEYSQAAEGFEDSQGQIVKEEDLIENLPTTPAKMGEVAQLGGVDIKLEKVYDIGIIKEGEIFNYDRKVIAIVYEITNNTDTDIVANSFDLNLQYMDGEQVTVMSGVESMLRAQEKITDIDMFNSTIKPGETLKGYTPLAFYSRWENITVYYTPHFYEGKDAVSFDISKDMLEVLN